ncbi:outer membrane protein assembly factor BamE [Teredinibacter turnerae]|uniref:outer membrane protein assembly factor BamE n=1 Tax=Teredinibacter turnerae TaxID=2426 RepID=UPI0003633B4C|nr:outer membrane protein assembly factor BamE [Teredinibacter turnerae]
MQFVLKAALLAAAVLAFTGCSKLQFPWAYKIYIQQGNYLEEDMIEQLEVGMTPEQVRYIMGTPMVTDTFHPDRWDYYFEYKRGDKVFKEYHFTVHFNEGLLASWEGDYQTRAAKQEEEAKEFNDAAAEVDKESKKEEKTSGTKEKAVSEKTDTAEG